MCAVTTSRFRDGGAYLRELAHEVLAVCPSCGGRVTAVTRDGMRRAACPACGWIREVTTRASTWGGPEEPYLGLPLWLRTECCGEVLWAFNAEHLDLLEGYVSAGLRERTDRGRTQSVAERLPAWLKSAKNRDEVLAAIARLRERLNYTVV